MDSSEGKLGVDGHTPAFKLVVSAWLIWTAFAILLILFQPKVLERFGQFGDMFGVLNTLFTGLAFAGLVLTLHIQAR